MARETKVGLLVGLGVILLIGIIVSDHLSVVQSQEPAEMTDFGPRAQRSVSAPVLELPEPEAREPLVQESAPVAPLRADAAGGPGELRAEAPASLDAPPPVMTFGGDAVNIGPVVAARTEPGRFSVLPREPLPEVASINPVLPRPSAPATPRTLAGGSTSADGVPTIGLPGGADAAVAAAPPVASAPPVAVPAAPAVAALATHTVERGDSVYRLARHYYNDGESWRLIQQANPSLVGKDGQLREGVKLVIPAKAGGAFAVAPRPEAAPARRQAQAENPLVREAPDLFEAVADVPGGGSGPAGVKTIEVQAQETLSSLAARHLGSSKRWPELLAANRDQIQRPEQLRQGMKLRVPSDGGAAQTAAAPRSLFDSPAATGRTFAAASPAVGATYTVQASDTLAAIAAKTLGDRNRWGEIYEVNRDKLKDPSKVRPGQVLVLPVSGR